MKKFLSVICCLAIILSLAACGGGGGDALKGTWEQEGEGEEGEWGGRGAFRTGLAFLRRSRKRGKASEQWEAIQKFSTQ